MKRRWLGQVPLSHVLWRDMLLLGSLVNLLMTFIALIIASQIGAGVAAAVVHFAALPLNVWLWIVVARSTARTPIVMALASIWFVVMLVF